MANENREQGQHADRSGTAPEEYCDTIDWDDYWEGIERGAYSNVDSNPSAEYVCEPLLEFLDGRIDPDSYADVGCGTGSVVFAVADTYPESTVIGYDAAEPILARNRERARTDRRTNARFERAVLPDFSPDRRFDVVSSFFTLCYVGDVERALRNLYDAVAPGGYLVFTYHNRFARSYYEEVAESPRGYLDGSFPSDPERFYERFQLVLEGESTLSYERVHETLDTWPQSVWSETDEADRYGAWRSIPLVYVPK